MNVENLVEGIVVDNSDPQEMGRVRVWCPSKDGEGDSTKIKSLPWARYMSPFAGQADGFQGGSRGGQPTGPVSYGFWGIPKLGATVVVGFLYGDENQRVYLGSLYPTHGNRSLPVGRNSAGAPTSDSFDEIEPQLSNLTAQFGGDLSSSIARTRGAYERQVAQAATQKTTEEGYQPRVRTAGEEAVGDLDPQTYCLTTPGRHSLIFQDHPTTARVRIKTADGSQIILDDANERIYVSVARGKTWLELDRDGHVHLYAAESISMSAGKDFNLQALGSVNISAGKNVNIGASGHARITACSDLSLSGKGMNITSEAAMDILAAGTILQTGSAIHLNGPGAATAPCATGPTIVPSHEPWDRPASTDVRGPNWRA